MLIAILVGVFALVFTYITVRKENIDPSEFTDRHLMPLTTAVAIICGDCSGDAYEPRITYLDSLGNCAQCGGRSYILAPDCSAYAQPSILLRPAEHRGRAAGNRVLAFRAPAKCSMVQS